MSTTPAQHLIDAVAAVVEAARVRSDLPDISRAADELEQLRPASEGSGSCPAKVTELLDEPLIALAVWTDDLDAPALLDEPVT